MHPTIVLPHLVAGRDLADAMIDGLAASLHDRVVVVDARATSSGSSSFASQLVQRVLVDEGARSLVLVGAPARFVRAVQESAERQDVTPRVELADRAPQPA